MEAPMKRWHFIAFDTHSKSCDAAVVNWVGDVVNRSRCETTIPALLQIVEAVPRPRAVVIEEGPLAGWIWRGLRDAVDRMVVSQPRRNRLISAEGDKDDPIDAEKRPSCCGAASLRKCTRSILWSGRCSSNR